MSSGVVKLYLPSFGWLYRGGHFDVVVDGASVGEVWPRQVKVFDVPPGDHRIQLRFWPWMRTRKFDFSVASGGVVELACSPGWTWLPGGEELHLATLEERELMRKSTANMPPPKNLGA